MFCKKAFGDLCWDTAQVSAGIGAAEHLAVPSCSRAGASHASVVPSNQWDLAALIREGDFSAFATHARWQLTSKLVCLTLAGPSHELLLAAGLAVPEAHSAGTRLTALIVSN